MFTVGPPHVRQQRRVASGGGRLGACMCTHTHTHAHGGRCTRAAAAAAAGIKGPTPHVPSAPRAPHHAHAVQLASYTQQRCRRKVGGGRVPHGYTAGGCRRRRSRRGPRSSPGEKPVVIILSGSGRYRRRTLAFRRRRCWALVWQNKK